MLFDGTTLEGWTTTGGRYDGKADWSVEDGAITGREGPGGEGGLIYTEAEYADTVFTFRPHTGSTAMVARCDRTS